MSATRVNGAVCAGMGLFLLAVVGCSSQTRMPPPPELHDDLTLFGQAHLRVWGDDPVAIDHELLEDLKLRYEEREGSQIAFLAISGGGSHGAYGAGVLAGWTDTGNRPRFALVTGVSTGALIAPFAFLGSEYDDLLRTLYTTTRTRDLVRQRFLSGLFGGDSLLDSGPMRQLIETYITDELLERIAEQSRLGRVLIIGTTNLDAGRPVLWNITRIAEMGTAEGMDLIRDVILASASIPGAFPPVYIQLEYSDGHHYDEMHADGGIGNQIFLFPPRFPVRDILSELNVDEKPTAYLIRNDFVRPRYDPLEPRLIPITTRTINSLLRTQGNGDLFRIRQAAMDENIDVQLTWIPQDVLEIERKEMFDPVFMQAVFDLGYERAHSGDAWSDASEPLSGSTFPPQEQ